MWMGWIGLGGWKIDGIIVRLHRPLSSSTPRTESEEHEERPDQVSLPLGREQPDEKRRRRFDCGYGGSVDRCDTYEMIYNYAHPRDFEGVSPVVRPGGLDEPPLHVLARGDEHHLFPAKFWCALVSVPTASGCSTSRGTHTKTCLVGQDQVDAEHHNDGGLDGARPDVLEDCACVDTFER
jgi:hypothetical protein